MMIYLLWVLVIVLVAERIAAKVLFEKKMEQKDRFAAEQTSQILGLQRERDDNVLKVAQILSYHSQCRGHLLSFDQVLNGLPKGDFTHLPPVHKIIERKAFDWAASHILSEDVPANAVAPVMEFESVGVRLGGESFTGWRRNGWVMVPKEALRGA